MVTDHLAPKLFRPGYLAPYSRTMEYYIWSELALVYGLIN